MNIDSNAAQKSAIICWRHLLRTLDGLPTQNTVGSECAEVSFVAEGLKTRDGLQAILAFLTVDIPTDIETRQEIFCANVNDMLALNVFVGIPDDAFAKTKDEKVSQEIFATQQHLDELVALFSGDEDEDDDEIDYNNDWMFREMDLDVISDKKDTIENLKKREFRITVNYNTYLQHLCSKLSNISSQQCFALDETLQSLMELENVGVESLSQRVDNHRRHKLPHNLHQKTHP